MQGATHSGLRSPPNKGLQTPIWLVEQLVDFLINQADHIHGSPLEEKEASVHPRPEDAGLSQLPEAKALRFSAANLR